MPAPLSKFVIVIHKKSKNIFIVNQFIAFFMSAVRVKFDYFLSHLFIFMPKSEQNKNFEFFSKTSIIPVIFTLPV